LWFIDQLEGASVEYNMPQALRLRGELNIEALGRAVNTIVERHESLRTHFVAIDGEPMQIIVPALKVDVPVADLSDCDDPQQQTAVHEAIEREWKQPFDLTRGPVLRVRLLRLDASDHVLLITLHHIVSDGWSIGLFSDELVKLYESFQAGQENPLPSLPVQYADFALWQRGWLDDAAMRTGVDYWKQQLAGAPEQLVLPSDRSRPPTQSYAAGVAPDDLSRRS
jgi:hypothetical protein